VGDLLDGYTPERAWDEMFAAPDEPRSHYAALHQVLGRLARDDFEARCAARDRAFHDQGITFSHSGEERPFPLDLVPRIIDAAEWAVVESGVRQRVLALERFLADVYGPGEILADSVVPRRLVASSPHFHRSVHGIDPAGGVRVHVAGVDLVRDGAGSFRVLEDSLRTPSGISYVIENRRAGGVVAHVRRVRDRDHQRVHHRGGGAACRTGRVPGRRAPGGGGAAGRRHPGALRVGLPLSRPAGRRDRDHASR
jgi:uncharacterized circularly permuted ATP-grasp superfamily protein